MDMNIKEYITKKNISIALLLLFAIVIILNPVYAGGLLLFSIVIFGLISSRAQDHPTKLISLGCLVVLALLVLLITPLNYGIDFKGGVRIPLSLEKPVDEQTMNLLVNKIKERLSSLGLKQISVKAIGDSQIYVEVPESDKESIQKLEDLVERQGVYEGIVDGEVVISGRDIIPGTVYRLPASVLRGADWGVAFSVTGEASEDFAAKVKGKAGKPLHMYLDRPKNSIFVVPADALFSNISSYDNFDEVKALIAVKDVLLDNEIVFDSDFDPSVLDNNATVYVYNGSKWASQLEGKPNVYIFNSLPVFSLSSSGSVFVDRWDAIGLLSSPVLSPGVTKGIPLQSFSITGAASSKEDANEKAKLIETILKGGSLPVKVFAGSKTSIPAKLGEKFFYYSFIGLIAALLFVSIFVAIRYKRLKLIVPILVITFLEVLILFATMGAFTLDLAAMAGIIAAVGMSIDDQIIITDELLKKGRAKEKLEKAFDIIITDATIIIISMLPLLFSSFVEVIGFSVSTILGALLGALISRPAYAVLVEEFLKDEIGE